MFGIDERIKEAFREVTVDVPGIRGIVLSTVDGLPIASDIKSEERQNRIAAMVSALVTLSKKVAPEVEVGNLDAVSIEADEGKIFCYMIAGEEVSNPAILAIVTSRELNLGILRMVVPKLIDRLREIIF